MLGHCGPFSMFLFILFFNMLGFPESTLARIQFVGTRLTRRIDPRYSLDETDRPAHPGSAKVVIKPVTAPIKGIGVKDIIIIFKRFLVRTVIF